MLHTAAFASLVFASLARAGLSSMRATIPGSIHQCAASNVFFFDTNDSGSKTLLFVSPEDASNLGPGQLSLSSVLSSITPLQTIAGINSADAAEFDFTVELAENVAFSTLGFLSDGTGKNMNLDRTVMQPLPDAPNCLSGNSATAAANNVQVPSSSSSVLPEVASSSSSAAPSTSTTPAPAPATTTSVKATATASSSTEYASRFVTSTKPKATSSAASVATSAAAISASLSLPPASSSANTTATATLGNATAPAAAATSPVVVQAKFLLTSFIEISNDMTSDGTVSSSVIKGGQVVGAVNGTILPIGNVLYAPNSTALPSNSTTAANATAQAQTMLLSTSYTFTTEEGESVFVMAQTPLAQNFTTETLLMDFQSSESNSTLFSNITVLGKAETINATMFRIDAYYLNDASL